VAALDLETLTWRILAPLPEPVSVGGVTTDGASVFVAGTRQGDRNDIIGEHVAFQSTASGGWTTLPPVPISGQASTVHWVDGAGLLAWNYLAEAAVLDDFGAWRRLADAPLDMGECYPQMTGVGGGAVGECGGLVWFDGERQAWSVIPSWSTELVSHDWVFVTLSDVQLALLPTDSGALRLLRLPLDGAVPIGE
jgi:hypothetical protein